jgi:hypothetical protein
VNWVDVVIVVLLVSAAGHGLLRGAIVQTLSFGGRVGPSPRVIHRLVQ